MPARPRSHEARASGSGPGSAENDHDPELLLEAARVLLRVDDVVQATRKDRGQEQGGGGAPPEEAMEG